ncbi:MAG: hypothetical protein IT176_12510 [Acidobacteria bacterium]|nr:hypothetical protein [Acidobacteriota bacterium]
MGHRTPARRAAGIGILAALAAGSPAFAQDEAALRSYFEGQRVVVKIDMPGTSDGVDVHAGGERPLDFRRHGERLKDYGSAIRAGESATVTLVKVKKDLVEVQLGGGGYGTFGDDYGTTVSIPLMQKSQREKDLEVRVRDEPDARRRRQLQRELDEVRRDRERENRRIEALRIEAEEARKARVAAERLRGGSRFNIRYADAVPANFSPEDLIAILREYVEFPGEASPAPAGAAADERLWKGMRRDEVERALGPPVEVAERREGSLTVVTAVFTRPGERIAAEFVEEVLIRYSVASR